MKTYTGEQVSEILTINDAFESFYSMQLLIPNEKVAEEAKGLIKRVEPFLNVPVMNFHKTRLTKKLRNSGYSAN